MRERLKIIVLTTSKWLGLFWISRKLTRNRVRILCYHGFSVDDQHRFRPGLFMTPETFAARMAYLARKQFPVVSLAQAMARHQDHGLPACATVITIDDGFYSAYWCAREVLSKHQFPATLYLTSYYFDKGVPIFRLAVYYMLWKTQSVGVTVSLPDKSADARMAIDANNWEQVASDVVAYGEALDGEEHRQALAQRLGREVGIDYSDICARRLFSLINADELRELEKAGITIELHTHRHRFPTDVEAAAGEIEDNRHAVEPVAARRLLHFCYPSGVWDEAHWPVLERQDVASATTCLSGLMSAKTHRYAVPRILDDSRISQIDFEAEMSGYTELTRYVRRWMKNRTHGGGEISQRF